MSGETQSVREASRQHRDLALLRRYHRFEDLEARAELIERLMPLVGHVARRYAGRGEPLDDLMQIGAIGLMKAIDRFEPGQGVKLSTFAVPNITGEIRRYFRDHTWSVRVPREIQELTLKLNRATDSLTAHLGRSPTVAELAEAVGADEEQVLDALQGAQAYASVSFEQPIGEEQSALDRLGEEDPAFSLVEARELVEQGLRHLPERELRIVQMRFLEDRTQIEIAAEMHCSQMHISRLIRQSLQTLHGAVTTSPPLATRRSRAA